MAPPAETYAVYFDEVEADGSDPIPHGGSPVILKHFVSIELYAPEQDPNSEAALESALCTRGLLWTKSDRIWLREAQRYQTVYDLDYTEKRRK